MEPKLPYTVGYVSVADPHDRRSWSGTHYFLMKALEERFLEVVPLAPMEPQPEQFIGQAFNQITLKVLGKRFNHRDSFLLARAYRRVLHRRMRGRHFDLLVAPAGLTAVALLDTDVPIVHINDRCLAGALGYHAILRDLLPFSQREGLALEQRTLGEATLNIYASHWAADAARLVAPDLPGRIHTIPFGVNLPLIPPIPAARAFPEGPLRLLFIGTKWVEKGGPIAYDALQALKRQGIKATLTVCGSMPPEQFNDPALLREGFLDKNDPAQLARLQELLRTADFLIVPTRFEAYGIVFCEAAAYGVPALATRTGGVPTIIDHGVTGFLFGPEERGAAYAERIMQLLGRPEQWQAMRAAARARFEQQFTWPAFVDGLVDQLSELGVIKSSR